MINEQTIERAIKIIQAEKNPSLSLLRVRLNLSLEDAQSVMDHLVNIGFISDYKNGSPVILNPTSPKTDPSVNPKQIPFDIDSIEGHDFEYFCADLLRFNGYNNIRVTTGSGDFGVDIIAYNHDQSYAIQCKRFKSNVGNKAVQEITSGKIFYKCDKAVVMTNSYFTPAAIETARLTDVILWDRGMIKTLLITATNNGFIPSNYT